MRQSLAFKATTQDVCIFCAFRSASATRAITARRRLFNSNNGLASRQQAGLSAQEIDDDGGWGGLAEEVEAAVPKSSPPPPAAPPERPAQRQQHDGRVRYADGFQRGRDITRHDSAQRQNGSSSILRIRKMVGRENQRNPGLDIDEERIARWSIGRRNQASGEHSSIPPTDSVPTNTQQPAAQPTSNRRLRSHPLETVKSSWSQATSGPSSYVAFDPRFSRSEEPRPVRHVPEQQSARYIPKQPVGQSTPEQEPARNAPERGPTITKHIMESRPTLPAREELDEYGLPISKDASSQAQPSSRSARRFEPKTSSRVERNPKTARGPQREEQIEDYESRRDDRKKSRGRNTRHEDEEDDDYDVEDYHRRKRERKAAKAKAKDAAKMREERRTIRLPDFISVGSLATELQLRYQRFAGILEKFGFEDVNSDFVLSAENAALIVDEAGFTAITESEGPDKDLYAAPMPEDIASLPQRPPVVTIMGHVDHGKTTILDYMRKSSIVASEHGGITQHIGAFNVPMPSGKTITFLDTPGHAAFLSMRQRGANVTDIVVLVVAADDSVMPQTLEALKHARGANVPIIVAMNKIDKPEAKPDQVKQDLARHGVEIEDYGGDVQVVEVSGKTGQGIPDLEEAIIALSEIQDQRAPVDGNVEGWVLESSTKEVGKVATVLIRRGTLRPGDIVVAGAEYCRVRTMRDEFGNQISEVGPGMPAEIDGWRGQPNAGDEVLQAENEQIAGDVADLREAKLKRIGLGKDVEAINEMRKSHQRRHEREKALERAKKAGMELPDEATAENEDGPGIKEVYFIVKGDVAGSAEAVVNAIATLGNGEVQPVILKSAVGAISESDVDHATAAGGHVISFNMAISPTMRALAERAGTKILDHNIIYRLVDDVKVSLEDVFPPIVKSRSVGEAEIAQIFEITQKKKVIKIAGCKVRNGTIMRNSKVRVLRGRGNEVVYTGTFSSLKNVKKDVLEMPKGSECGMGFLDWQDFQPGDIAQCYEEWEERRTL